MSPEISERSLEEAIECGLLQGGPDACPGEAPAVRETQPPCGDTPPGGYRKRRPDQMMEKLDDDAALDAAARVIVSCQRSPEPVFLTWKGMEDPSPPHVGL